MLRSTKSWKTVAACALLPALGTAAAAQDPALAKGPANAPLAASLYRAWSARDLPRADLERRAPQLRVNEAHEAQVEVVAPRGAGAVPDALVERFGGRVAARGRRSVEAWVPVDSLLDLARALPAGHELLRANPGVPTDVAGEGPARMRSDTYRDAGYAGLDLKVAIIDLEFGGLDAAIANGDFGGATALDLGSGDFQDGGTHGTSCAEVLYDHAPAATYRLYRVDSLADVDTAVVDCFNEEVDVISISLAYYNLEWNDGESSPSLAFDWAGSMGIMTFTSAGNDAEKHWQGFFDAGGNDPEMHDWLLGDEGNGVIVPPGGSLAAYLNWNDNASGTDDYDLWLWDEGMTTVLESSRSIDEIPEDLEWTNASGVPVRVQLSVTLEDGSGTEFELFVDVKDMTGADVTGAMMNMEYVLPASSTVVPADATHANVITVGAVTQSLYDTAAGGWPISTYSSRGPTNSGSRGVDLVAPTDVQTFSDGGTFGGTSCATPNAAGAAVVLLTDQWTYSDSALRFLIEQKARIFHDWGSPGADAVYGYGGMGLQPFAPNTEYLSRAYGNTSNAETAPYYDLVAAVAEVAVSGGRVVEIPGGNYPQASTLDVLGVELDSLGGPAVFGDE